MGDDPIAGEQLKTAKLSREAASDVGTVAKGGAVQIAGQVTERSLSFFYKAIALEILGRGGLGLYSQVIQLLALGGQLALAGFNYASMRFITLARAQSRPGGVRGAIRVGIFAAAIGSLVVMVVLAFAASPLSRVFADTAADRSNFARLLRIGIAYVPLFALMQVLRYCTQAYKTMVPSVVAGSIVKPATRFLVGFALLLAGYSVAGAITSMVIAGAVGALVAGWFLSRMLTQEEKAATPLHEVGPMVRFALPQGGASLFGVQTLGMGILILGWMSGDAQVAFFSVALSLQGPGNVFLGGIVNIWAPVVSDLHARGDIARLDSLYKTINRWIATFSFPLFAVMIIEGDIFLRTFFPNAFPGGVAVVALLAAGNLFYTGTGPTGYVISMTGRPGVNFANSVAGVVLYALLGWWLVPEHGAVGMAAVDAIVTALINSVRVVQAKVLVGVQPFGRSFFKPVAATLGASAFLLAWSRFAQGEWALEWTGIVIAGVVYLGLLKLMGVDPEEREVWQRIRKRAFKRGRS